MLSFWRFFSLILADFALSRVSRYSRIPTNKQTNDLLLKRLPKGFCLLWVALVCGWLFVHDFLWQETYQAKPKKKMREDAHVDLFIICICFQSGGSSSTYTPWGLTWNSKTLWFLRCFVPFPKECIFQVPCQTLGVFHIALHEAQLDREFEQEFLVNRRCDLKTKQNF